MDYKEIILAQKEKINPVLVQDYLTNLINLFTTLKDSGFTLKDLDCETAETILNIFKNSQLTDYYQIKLSKYLILYIEYVSKMVLNCNNFTVNEVKQPEKFNDCELIDPITVIPSTKNMEIDEEFLKQLNG
jgi:hypothetical protein